jgi:hypothetical protein
MHRSVSPHFLEIFVCLLRSRSFTSVSMKFWFTVTWRRLYVNTNCAWIERQWNYLAIFWFVLHVHSLQSWSKDLSLYWPRTTLCVQLQALQEDSMIYTCRCGMDAACLKSVNSVWENFEAILIENDLIFCFNRPCGSWFHIGTCLLNIHAATSWNVPHLKRTLTSVMSHKTWKRAHGWPWLPYTL